MLSKHILTLTFLLAMYHSSSSQNFGYQGKKLEVSLGTEITTNPSYSDYATFKEKNDVQSGLGLSFSLSAGFNYLIFSRFGIGLNYSLQTLFVGYRVPGPGIFTLNNETNFDPEVPVNLSSIPFKIKDKNRYRSTVKKGITLRYYRNRLIANASSYAQFEFGVINVESDKDEVYSYSFYEETGALTNFSDVESTKVLKTYESISNTKIPTFKYVSIGYFFRKELPFAERLFLDVGLTFSGVFRGSEVDSEGGSYSYEEPTGVSDENIERYIKANTWQFVKRHQAFKTHIKINYLF